MGGIGKQSAVGRSVHNLHGRVKPEEGFAFAVALSVNRRDALCLRDRRRVIRVGHPERLQDFCLHVSGIGLAGDDLDHPPEYEQRGVGIFELAARLEAQLAPRNGPHDLRKLLLQPRVIQRTADGPAGPARRRIGDQTGSVRHQMPNREGVMKSVGVRLLAEFRQVLLDRIVEREFLRIDERHGRRHRDGFGNGRDPAERVGGERKLVFNVPQAVRFVPEDRAAARHQRNRARHLLPFHRFADEAERRLERFHEFRATPVGDGGQTDGGERKG